ncbi:hypothetical protein EDD37DRAFT_673830 [Exophiala viscosa]|uniref:uncharacterized protein n=1 Tax=Exophiala viscosa TaxID=2486360 RepID=UPI00218DC27D|nr:hypothetical protein EDD37DRAFT_673830 [Exophiala viscosa]
MTRRDLHLMRSTTEMTTTKPIPGKHQDEDDEIEWETVTTASSETERGDIDMDSTLPNGALLPPSPPCDSDFTLPSSHPEPEPRKRLSYKDALCSSPAAEDNDALPIVLVEEYDPDTTLMSGAVDPRDADIPVTLGLSSSDEEIICSTRSAYKHCYDKMPYRVLHRYHLYELGLPFKDTRHLDALTPNFLTTFRGVDRAWDEFEEIERDYQRAVRADESFELDLDEYLLVALAKRGGRSRRQVVYPEYIYPLWPKWEDGSDSSEAETEREDKREAGAGEDTNASGEKRPTTRKQRARFELDFTFDDAYWIELEDQGIIWDEIDVPRL